MFRTYRNQAFNFQSVFLPHTKLNACVHTPAILQEMQSPITRPREPPLQRKYILREAQSPKTTVQVPTWIDRTIVWLMACHSSSSSDS